MDFTALNFVDYAILVGARYFSYSIDITRHDSRGFRSGWVGDFGNCCTLLAPILEEPILSIIPNEDLSAGIAWAIPFIVMVILWFVRLTLIFARIEKSRAWCLR